MCIVTGDTDYDVYFEEFNRLNAELPAGADRHNLAKSAADVEWRKRKQKLINKLKIENEKR